MPRDSAWSSAGAPATFDATAATGMPASIRACRLVPVPLTRTPTLSESLPTDALALDDLAYREIACPDVGGRHDRAVTDPDVEDAPELVLRHALLREPAEDLRTLPGRRVDDGREPLGQHPPEAARDPAAGDVREPAHIRPRAESPNVLEVEARRRQQQVGIEGPVSDDPADEREPVCVDAGRRESEDD